jgi:hypothetical protein
MLSVDGELLIKWDVDYYLVEFCSYDGELVVLDLVKSSLIEFYKEFEGDCKLVFDKVDEETIKMLLMKGDKRLWLDTFGPNNPYLKHLMRKFGGVMSGKND